ncbi:hypothetical protein J2S47_002353 [Streptomyces griseoviridis]|uniref:Uncharacterized protein n=1 Tax=Streptomyces griseoviridis TaxID=45398 RepID=A0ABT9LDR1_STRGD|nr:hypothetical protein [Streptomyces griseoviridis]
MTVYVQPDARTTLPPPAALTVREVRPATGVLAGDAARAPLPRIGPVLDAALTQPLIRAVEQLVVDQEHVMPHPDLHRWLGELKQHAVGEPDAGERAPGRRFRASDSRRKN